MIVPAALHKAYQLLGDGHAWVAVLIDGDQTWVYHSAATLEDVAEDIEDMSEPERTAYLIEGLLEMQTHATEVDIDS